MGAVERRQANNPQAILLVQAITLDIPQAAIVAK